MKCTFWSLHIPTVNGCNNLLQNGRCRASLSQPAFPQRRVFDSNQLSSCLPMKLNPLLTRQPYTSNHQPKT